MTTHHAVFEDGTIIGRRSSARRVYTHAVIATGAAGSYTHAGQRYALSWHGTHAHAVKAANLASRQERIYTDVAIIAATYMKSRTSTEPCDGGGLRLGTASCPGRRDCAGTIVAVHVYEDQNPACLFCGAEEEETLHDMTAPDDDVPDAIAFADEAEDFGGWFARQEERRQMGIDT